MMKDIIIVGAGGFGREVYYLIKRINEHTPTWNIKGFIDDNPHALDGVKCDATIIGSISEWQPKADEFFAMGLASPATKEELSALLKARGAKFATLIDPRTLLYDYITFGEGCVVIAGMISDNVTIGNFVHVAGSMIGQDSTIGDYSTTTGYANIVSAKLGKRVFVGSQAVVLNNVKVGDDAFVCVGSVVMKNVKSGVKVHGNPAQETFL